MVSIISQCSGPTDKLSLPGQTTSERREREVSFPIRGAVYYNIKEMGPQQLKSMVEDSIQGEEKLLPGLGVLFEVIWKNSNPNDRKAMIQTLHNSLPKS